MSQVILIYTIQDTCAYSSTVLLKNMETQRFKIQLATGFFAAANHDDYHNNTALSQNTAP